MTAQGQLLATITAGTAGALVATLAVGASILLVLPAVIGVTAIALATERGNRDHGEGDPSQHPSADDALTRASVPGASVPGASVPGAPDAGPEH